MVLCRAPLLNGDVIAQVMQQEVRVLLRSVLQEYQEELDRRYRLNIMVNAHRKSVSVAEAISLPDDLCFFPRIGKIETWEGIELGRSRVEDVRPSRRR